jgi:hypothetical protein
MILRFDERPTPPPRTPAVTVTRPEPEFAHLLVLAAERALIDRPADQWSVTTVLDTIAACGADLDAGARRVLRGLLVEHGPWFDRERVPEAEKRRWERALGALAD